MPEKPKRSLPHVGLPVVLLLAVLAAGLGLWVARRNVPEPLPAPPPPPATAKADPSNPATGSTSPTGTGTPSVMVPTPVAPVASREDEEKLYAWLTGFDDPVKAGEAILEGWDALTEGGRTAAAPHLLNLVPDEKFASLEKILLAPNTSAEVKEIIFNGVLNRGDEVKWPLILKVMEQKQHPQSEQARNILTVVLNGDYGDDWERWRSLVDTRLVKQMPQ